MVICFPNDTIRTVAGESTPMAVREKIYKLNYVLVYCMRVINHTKQSFGFITCLFNVKKGVNCMMTVFGERLEREEYLYSNLYNRQII